MRWKSVLAMLAWVVGVLGFIGSFGYAIYSVETGTGPGGWLVDLQLQWRGSYGTKLTLLVTWVLVVVAMTPLWIGLAVLLARLGPAPGSAQPQPRAPAAASDAPVSLMVWSGVFLVVAGCAVGGGGFLVLHVLHERESGHVFEPVTLTQGPAAAAPSSAYLAIEGVAQTRLVYAIGKRGEYASKDFYMPLTAPNWAPSDAVRYVLLIKDRRGALGPDDVRGPFHVVAEAGRVPQFVRSAYEKEGVAMDRNSYLVERRPVAGGRVARRSDGEMDFLVGGGLVAALGLLMAIVGWVRQRLGGRRAGARVASGASS
jgi:hypothetical protein